MVNPQGEITVALQGFIFIDLVCEKLVPALHRVQEIILATLLGNGV